MKPGNETVGMESGKEAGEWSQLTSLRLSLEQGWESGAWEVELGNEAGEWNLGMRLGEQSIEKRLGEWSLGTRLESGIWE